MPSVTKSAGTVVDDTSVGVYAWADPSNATASDNARASTVTLSPGSITHYLKCTNFGFSIPSGATIDGIECRVEWASLSGFWPARRYRARIVKAGAIGSDTSNDSSSTLPSSDTVQTIGTPTSLWGQTWSYTDINASTFGVALACQGPIFASGSADIDHVQLTVYYTQTSPTIQAVPAAAAAVSPPGLPLLDGTFVMVAWQPSSPPVISEYTSLSTDVRGYEIRRGRPFNLERVETGTATVTFNNETGDLDPANPNGVYYPHVLPVKPLRIRHVRNGVVYDRFAGRIERFRAEWAPPSWQFMTVDASDEFEWLANKVLESEYATLTTNLAGSNNDLVFTAREAGDPGEQVTVEYVVAGASTELSVGTNDPSQALGTVRFETPVRSDSVSALFRGGLRALISPRPTQPASATVTGTDITVNVATTGGGAANSSANDVRTALTASDEAMALLASVELAAGNNGSGVVAAMSKTSLDGGKWQSESTGTRINRVLNEVGWNAPRDIDAGAESIVAQGFSSRENVSALQHIQDAADSELGYAFMSGDGTFVFHDGSHRANDTRSTTSQATFSDDGTGLPYVDIEIVSLEKDRIANEILVTSGNSNAPPQVAGDTESQELFQRRTLNRQTRLSSEVAAQNQAYSILNAYKTPYTRFDAVTLIDDGTADWADAVLAREIGDRVTVKTTPPVSGATPYTLQYECFIEGIEERFVPGEPLRVTFRLTISEQDVTQPGTAGALLDSSGDDLTLDDANKGVLGGASTLRVITPGPATGAASSAVTVIVKVAPSAASAAAAGNAPTVTGSVPATVVQATAATAYGGNIPDPLPWMDATGLTPPTVTTTGARTVTAPAATAAAAKALTGSISKTGFPPAASAAAAGNPPTVI